MDQKSELPHLGNDPTERIVQLFKAIHKIYKDQLCKKSRQFGLTGPQIGLIFALHKKPYSTLNDISEWIGLSKSTVSGIVDRLVKQEIVIREIPKDNRRIVQLSLSPEFQKDNVLDNFMNEFMTNLFKDVKQDELAKIIEGLEIMYQLVKETEDEEYN